MRNVCNNLINMPDTSPRGRSSPTFENLRAASARASATARAASGKANTRCEMTLRRQLWRRGLRYRLNSPTLPGRPDIVFPRYRVAVFCDGDFWHGRNLAMRVAKLSRGHNANYWMAKVQRNVARDRSQTRALRNAGWMVLRFWESDILHRADAIVDQITSALDRQSSLQTRRARV
jgi:DNA mismatch endonuclease (patch repair protein)